MEVQLKHVSDDNKTMIVSVLFQAGNGDESPIWLSDIADVIRPCHLSTDRTKCLLSATPHHLTNMFSFKAVAVSLSLKHFYRPVQGKWAHLALNAHKLSDSQCFQAESLSTMFLFTHGLEHRTNEPSNKEWFSVVISHVIASAAPSRTGRKNLAAVQNPRAVTATLVAPTGKRINVGDIHSPVV
eukprot:504089-Hanusia_phi.AAC.1